MYILSLPKILPNATMSLDKFDDLNAQLKTIYKKS